MLDDLFLEPERARITEVPITGKGAEMLNLREPLSPDRLFSAAELRNDILAIEAAYAEFDLASTDFAAAAALVRRLSRDFIDRDFWIAIRPADLAALSDELGLSAALRSALVHPTTGYMACLSTYAPFSSGRRCLPFHSDPVEPFSLLLASTISLTVGNSFKSGQDSFSNRQ